MAASVSMGRAHRSAVSSELSSYPTWRFFILVLLLLLLLLFLLLFLLLLSSSLLLLPDFYECSISSPSSPSLLLHCPHLHFAVFVCTPRRVQATASRANTNPSSPVAEPTTIDLSSIPVTPPATAASDDVTPRLSVDATSGELLTMEVIVAALLCQRSRLLAIAHAHPSWCSKALRLPRGEPEPSTPAPLLQSDSATLLGKQQSLFEPNAAASSGRADGVTTSPRSGRSGLRGMGASTRGQSTMASEEERHRCLGLAYMDVHDSLALDPHQPLAELYRCAPRR